MILGDYGAHSMNQFGPNSGLPTKPSKLFGTPYMLISHARFVSPMASELFKDLNGKCWSLSSVLAPTRFPKYYCEQSTLVHFITSIPHICRFFTLAKFLENKIYTEKRQFFALNLYKTPIFRVKSVKIYTGHFFLHRHRLWCLWQIWGMDKTHKREHWLWTTSEEKCKLQSWNRQGY